MNFSEKAVSVRASVTATNQSINNTDVYNELLLQGIQSISPTGANTNTASAYTVSSTGNVIAGYVSVSLTTSATFSGTILGVTIAPNTTININAESGATLGTILYTVIAGSINIITLQRP